MPPVANVWGWMILRVAGITVEVQGKERLRELVPRVMVINHLSTLDIFWTASIIPVHSMGVAKKEFLWFPFFNLALWGSGSVFLDRGNREKAVASLKKVAAEIKRKNATVFIAPEGTRSLTGETQEFKKGAFRLALEAEVPVYPVVASGPYELMPKPAWFPKPGKILIKCLAPVDTSDWSEENLSEKIQEVRQAMIVARKELDEVRHSA